MVASFTETFNDFARPGDPDFTSFPKNLPEDTVSYSLYLLPSSTTHSGESHIRARLKDIQTAATALTKSLLGDYIWQREPFSFSISPPSSSSGGRASKSWSLQGKTEFGDSIADEWLVVYLLRELSKKFEDAWIRVVDADGEFLLIEAANALPKWLNPEVADYRVWINKGQLRIIPLERNISSSGSKTKARPRPISETLTLANALLYISQHPADLIHSSVIEAEAFYRLRNYPGQISASLHMAFVTIPRKLAFILHRAPSHISPAVEAFYLRDPISLRPLKTSNGSEKKLRFPPQDMVTVSVKFTRVGYAQLKSQEFTAPAVWESTLRKAGDDESTLRKRSEMGMKVACGFEMLVADPQNKDKRCMREIELLVEDIECGEERLPTDSEIAEWPRQEDDEGWLDVNFEDFEKELAGRGKGGGEPAGDFGDKSAQENLRRIVEQFEQFLDDDDAGVDGAEFADEMDYDDDDDDDDDNETHPNTPGEDRDASFDEEGLASMMNQMMGLTRNADLRHPGSVSRVEELDSHSDSDDGDEIKTVMDRMEVELRAAGALNLETSCAVQGSLTPHGTGPPQADDVNSDDPRLLLAKNFLESFKGQAGMTGPVGNLISSLGLTMPRDEDG